jgi:succinoglycan biosynthesis transport protein ExoP
MAKDALQQLENQLKSYIELGRRVLQRWWLILAFTLLGAGISVVLALNMTRVYQSRTLVAWQEVQDRAAFTGQEMRRQENWLRTRLEETLSSNTFLLRLMREMKVFSGMRKSVAPEEVLTLCRERIKFGMVGSDSFWIAFEYKDPKKAQQVASFLAKEFIGKSVRDSVSAAQSTLSFMEAEVKKARQELSEIEGRMAQFVSDHPEYRVLPAGGMPTAPTPRPSPTSGYVSVRGSPELRQALSEKGRLQAQLRVLMNPQADSRLIRARQEVDRAGRRIAALRRKYTDRHPDVQTAQQILRQAQMQLGLIQNASKGDTSTIRRLQSEIAALDKSIAKLSQPRRKRTTQPVKPVPTKRLLLTKQARQEKDWYSLTRDKEVATSKNDQLQTRLTRAKMTASLERKQAETQYTIVDHANLPQKPIRPNRSKLAMAGTALGLMIGLAIAMLLMIFDSRIYSQHDLRKVCDLPILAQVPKES